MAEAGPGPGTAADDIDGTWWVPADSRAEWPDPDLALPGILDSIVDPFYVYDRRGCLRDWNASFREVTGYSDAELAEMDPVRIIADDDAAAATQALARVAEGEEVTQRLALETKSGERIPHEVTATPLTDDDGEVWGLVGTARDISELAARTRELERYEQLIETVGHGMYVLDDEGHVQVVNDAITEMVGYDRADIVGSHFREFVTEETAADAVRHRNMLHWSDSDVATMEGELVPESGDPIPVEGRFSVLEDDGDAMMGLIRDVTDRNERAQLLERLHEGARDLMAAESVEAVAETATEVARRHFEFATNGVRLLRDGSLEMVSVSVDGESLEEYPPAYDVGEDFVGEVYERGEARVVPDIDEAASAYDYDVIESCILVPIEGWGLLGIGARERDAFDETDLELARLFAADVEQAFERAEREQRLREQNRDLREYETLVETMSDGVYMTDAEGRFTAVNDAFVALTGYDRETLLGMDASTVCVDREDGARRSDESTTPTETVVETAEGRRVPVEKRLSPVAGDDIGGTVAVVRDVSEREERERELRETKERLDLAVEGAELGTWDWNPQTGEVMFNERWATMLGYDPDDLDPHEDTWEDLVHPDDIDRAWDELAELVDGEVDRYECDYRMRTADGDWRWIRDIGRVFEYDEDGEPVRAAGIHLDVTERKGRERELERYERIVENLPVGVYRSTLGPDAEFVEANPAMADIFGADSARDLLARSPADLYRESDDRQPVAEHVMQEGVVTDFEREHRTLDGDTIWVSWTTIAVEENGETYFDGIVHDVTERKERQRRLREVKERLDVAVEGAELAIWDWNPKTGDLAFNDRWATMLGYDPDDLDQHYDTWKRLLHPDDHERTLATLEDFVEGEVDNYQCDYRMRTADGDWRWIRDIGRVVEWTDDGEAARAAGIHLDVTERKERERELRETKERLDLAVEGAELCIWDWNPKTGETTFDDRWATMLGYDPDDLEHHESTWESLVHPDDVDRAWDELERLVAGETDRYECDYRMRTADGDWKWVRSIGRIFERDADGDPVRAVGVRRDITERKERERQLRSQRDELERLDRINGLVQETIGALASAASREEIEETVCQRLGGSSLYPVAFTGVKQPGESYTEPQVLAGSDTVAPEDIEVADRQDAEEPGPTARAFERGEVTVVRDVDADPTLAAVRGRVEDRTVASAAVVPFAHGEVVHGILAVCADRPDAFSDREVQAFELLGEMVGFTVSATQDRRLIEADVPVELTVEVTDDQPVLTRLASALDATCRLIGTAKPSADGTLHYVAVEGASAVPGDDAVVVDDRVVEARRVSSDDERTVYELLIRESVPALLRELGARPTALVARDGELTVVAEAPRDADIRTLTERLDAAVGDASLVSKRDRNRWRDQPATMREAVVDRLTDRQRSALAAAYFAGYFEWPRESTAEEVADALGVASPTLHQHLRHAERKVFAALLRDFDETAGLDS